MSTLSLSEDESKYLEEVLAFFEDTADVFKLPHPVRNYVEFNAVCVQLSKLDSKTNMFGIYVLEGASPAWCLHYIGATISRPVEERLRDVVVAKDGQAQVPDQRLQIKRVNAALAFKRPVGIKVTRIVPEEMRLLLLRAVLQSFSEKLDWNV